MVYLAALIIALIIISLVPVSIILIGPKMLLMPDRRKSEYYLDRFGFNHPSQLGLQHEEGVISTKEGFRLSYWEVEDPNCKGTKGLVVFLHGITDRKESGLNYAKELTELCQKMYLVDMRCHGESGGKYCTYGYYEKHDVVGLIDKISAEKPGLPITLLGTSMGAAIAIQAAAIDSRVSRVIAIAPFYDLFSIALDHEYRRLGIKNEFLLRTVFRRAEKIADFDTSEVSPANDIMKIHVPILIVHGDLDNTVKRQYPERLAELNDRAELLSIKGAGHVDVLEKGGKAFVEKISEFLSSPA